MAERTHDSDSPQIGPVLQGVHDPDRLSALLRRAGWQIAAHDPGVYLRFEPPYVPQPVSLLVPLNPAAPEFDDTMQYAIDVLSAYMRIGEELTTAAALWTEHAEDRDRGGDGSHQAGHGAANASAVSVRPCRYEVSCLPDDHRYRRYATLYVERGQRGWCVTDGFVPARFMSRDGSLDSPFDYDDIDAFPSAHFEFSLKEACEVAEEYVPYLHVGDMTAADLLKAEAEQQDPSHTQAQPDAGGTRLSDVAHEALGRNLHAGTRPRDDDAKPGSTTAFPPSLYGRGRDSPRSDER